MFPVFIIELKMSWKFHFHINQDFTETIESISADVQQCVSNVITSQILKILGSPKTQTFLL